jgi:hypothetical protein
MELAEVTRRKDADQQGPHAKRKDVGCRPRIENSDARDQQIRNHRVEESPDNVDGRRGEPFSGRFCKGTLKGTPRDTGDKVRDGVYSNSASEKVRNKPNPIHVEELLFLNTKWKWARRGQREFNPQQAA